MCNDLVVSMCCHIPSWPIFVRAIELQFDFDSVLLWVCSGWCSCIFFTIIGCRQNKETADTYEYIAFVATAPLCLILWEELYCMLEVNYLSSSGDRL